MFYYNWEYDTTPSIPFDKDNELSEKQPFHMEKQYGERAEG
jgi:hypothetical protein